MPKFAANLSMMFNEVDFLDRFEAAARHGFKGVEFLFPYDYSPEVIAEKVEKNRLTLALFNTVPGNWADGERGLAAQPGREAEFRAGVDTAIRYAKAAKCPVVHSCRWRGFGHGREGQGRRTAHLYREFARWAADRLRAAPGRARCDHRADQHPRHPRLFPQLQL